MFFEFDKSGGFHNTVFPLGAIKASIHDYDVWLCNKYINCIYGNPEYNPNYWKLESYYTNRWFADGGTTHVQSMFLDADSYASKGIDIICFSKEMLKKQFYINGCWDEFYIKGKTGYQKEHFIHDYIIFGYDDENNIFKSAAYQTTGKYDYYDIDYDDFYNGIVESGKECPEVFYARINKKLKPVINIYAIKEFLIRYIDSKNEPLIQHLQGYFGVKAWEKFEEYVQLIGEKDLDLRFSRVYMEHRAVMYKRIRTLWEFGYLKDGNLQEIYYKNVYLPATRVHSLFLKYDLSKTVETRLKIQEMIHKTNMTEVKIINKLIENISEKSGRN